MSFFQTALKATVMSTEVLVQSNVSKKILFECLDIARAFEAKYSAYKEDSLLNKINKNAGVKSVQCEKEELYIFEKALEIAKLSNGKFDPTIGVLTQGAYGFGLKNSKIPSKEELKRKKELVDFRFFKMNDKSIYLSKKGMRLDLGGIGKGYVADIIIQHLIERGATKALVSVGGEICSFGKNYNIAIKNPFYDKNFAVIKTSKEPISISTSGDYERFIGTKENHHILDSKSAKPNHFYSSVTLIKNGMDVTTLDGAATILFNSQADELQEVSNKFGVATIAITSQKKILFENFENLNIKNIELYTLN